MAGVKVTDLPVLGAAASDDVLYIVDTSSNTSSQIEVSSLLPVLESGTWTPTLSAFSNAVTAATLNEATYIRVGNIVTCAIWLGITFDFSIDPIGELEFTYPIATTTANGGGAISSNALSQQINSSIRTNRIVLGSDTTLADNCSFFGTFQYEIN
jgi:hypothetical protein